MVPVNGKTQVSRLAACFLVRWMPFGGTTGLMIHSVMQAQVTQTVILALSTAVTSLWVAYSESFMTEAEQEMAKLGGQHARGFFQLGRVVTRKFQKRLTQLKWQIADDFRGQYYNRLDVICYGFETKGIALDKALSLQKIFVPVRLSPENLAQLCTNRLLELERPDTSEQAENLERAFRNQQELGHYLERMLPDRRFRRLALLGAPGSGKTTLMRYLTLMYAMRQPNVLHPNAPQLLPVLLYLRNVYEEILTNPRVTLPQLIAHHIETLKLSKPLTVPDGWFDEQLRQNRCLILLDGFDEVADANHRQAVSRWVDEQMAVWPDTPFILTSRPKGYEEAQLQQPVLVLKVEPFDWEQIEQFVGNWYREVELMRYLDREDVAAEEAHRQAAALLNEIDSSETLSNLATNPLLLTLMATVHQQHQSIPRKRVDLYQVICEVLLGKRQEAKGMPSQFSIAEKRSVLEPLALWLMTQKTRTFRFADVESVLQQHLAKLPDAPSPQVFLKQLEDVDALIAKEKEGDYEFAHLSFQEYLAAARVKETKDEDVFLQALKDPENLSWWAETMRLYAAQTDASRLVDAIVQEPALTKILLAWDFCQEGRVGASQRQALLTLSNEPLKVLEPEIYRSAVELQPRYFPLAHYLQTGQWKAADNETFEVMDRVMGGWSLQGIKEFPCRDLRVIDRLWLNYSQGKFGFSVQKQIWVEVGGKLDYAEDREAAEEAFLSMYDRVNWSTIEFSLEAPPGHLPSVSRYRSKSGWRLAVNWIMPKIGKRRRKHF